MKFYLIPLAVLVSVSVSGQKSNNGPSAEKGQKSFTIENQDDTIATQKMDIAHGEMGIQGGNVQVDDKYKFDHNIIMNTVSYDKKGVESGAQLMTLHFSNSSSMFGMEMNNPQTGKTSVIIDNEIGQMITLMNTQGQKIGMAAKLGANLMAQSENKDSTGEKISFTKTGNSKTISGFSCEEYIIEYSESSKNGKQMMWLTQESNSNWMSAMASMRESNKMFANAGPFPTEFPEGTLIQVVSENDKGQLQTVMTIEEINMNSPTTIVTTAYTFMNFGGGQIPSR